MPSPLMMSNAEFKKLGDYVTLKIKELSQKTDFSEHALTNALSDYILGEEDRKWGRERLWRVRILLYHDQPNADPVFDTDSHIPPGAPGDCTLLGLQAVSDYVVEAVSKYHKASCAGFDSATLKRKFNSLRSNMASRRNGSGTCRISYEAPMKYGARHMIARVDVHNYELYPQPQCLIAPKPFIGLVKKKLDSKLNLKPLGPS